MLIVVDSSCKVVSMSADHILVWNTCGLNNCAHRNTVRDIIEQHRATIVCL